jgi:hypothetical protein
MVVYQTKMKTKVKNLTVGKSYRVNRAYVSGRWANGKEDLDLPGQVGSVDLTNDKGISYGYSIRHFDLPEGVTADEKDIFVKYASDFQAELRSL